MLPKKLLKNGAAQLDAWERRFKIGTHIGSRFLISDRISLSFRQSLFWDVDPKTIDSKKHASYIIERILDLGNDKEIRWMNRQYSPAMIGRVVKKSRVLHAKSKKLWSLIYR